MKTVLITGASFGIGFELANVFAENKYDLFLIARNETKLKFVRDSIKSKYGVNVNYLSMDLSKLNAPDLIADYLKTNKIIIDILVNNAGFGVFGLFKDTDLEREIEMINLNVISLVKLTKIFLREMLLRRDGKILNVASTASFQPGPSMSLYYASKAFVLHFSEALAFELKGTGVSVSTLCPGPTATEFQATAQMQRSKLFSTLKPMNAVDVARIGYDGLMKGKSVILPGLFNKLSANAHRFFPRKLVIAVTNFIQSEK